MPILRQQVHQEKWAKEWTDAVQVLGLWQAVSVGASQLQ